MVGYVRVNAADQNEARQLEELGPVDRLFFGKVSGKNTDDKTHLQEILVYVGEGATPLPSFIDSLLSNLHSLS